MDEVNTLEKRVVITGVGVVSPVGIGKDAFWDALLSGKNGIGPITHFDATEYAARIAGEVKDFDPADYNIDRWLSTIPVSIWIRKTGTASVLLSVRASAAWKHCIISTKAYLPRARPGSIPSSFPR